MVVQLHFRSYEHKAAVGQSRARSFMASGSNWAAASSSSFWVTAWPWPETLPCFLSGELCCLRKLKQLCTGWVSARGSKQAEKGGGSRCGQLGLVCWGRNILIHSRAAPAPRLGYGMERRRCNEWKEKERSEAMLSSKWLGVELKPLGVFLSIFLKVFSVTSASQIWRKNKPSKYPN